MMQPQKTLLTNEPKSPYTQDLLDRWGQFEAAILANDTTGTFTKAHMERLYVCFLFGINAYLRVMGKLQEDLENENEPLEKVVKMAANFHVDILKLTKEM